MPAERTTPGVASSDKEEPAQDTAPAEEVQRETSRPWLASGEALEALEAVRCDWALRLHGANDFDSTGAVRGKRCWGGAGMASPEALEAQLETLRKVLLPERRTGHGATSALLIVPVTGRVPDHLWSQLDGFHVLAVYPGMEGVWAQPPDTADGDGVALALYWASADELKYTDRTGRRNAWWTAAPQLLGRRDLDETRLRQARQELPAVVDPLPEARRGALAMVAAARRAAERKDSGRSSLAEDTSSKAVASMFKVEDDRKKPDLMVFDAVLVNQRRGRLLLDTGATYSHADLSTARRRSWVLEHLKPHEKIRVALADGKVVSCDFATTLTICFGKCRTKVRVFLLPELAGYDVVLGTSWLREMEHDAKCPWTFSFVDRTVSLRPTGRAPIVLDTSDRSALTWYNRPGVQDMDISSHRDLVRAQREGAELHLLFVNPNGTVRSSQPIEAELSTVALTHDDIDAVSAARSSADDFTASLAKKLAGDRAVTEEPPPAPVGSGVATVEVVIWDSERKKVLLQRDTEGRAWLPAKQLANLADSMSASDLNDLSRWEAARIANHAAGAAIPARDCSLVTNGRGAGDAPLLQYTCQTPNEIAPPAGYLWVAPADIGDPPLSWPARAPALMELLARSHARSGGGISLTDEERADDGLMGDVPDTVRPPEESFLVKGAEKLLRELETANSDVLVEKDGMKLPPSRGEYDFPINTRAEDGPVCFGSRKLPPDGIRELNEQMQSMVKLGLARTSSSPWGAPVLFAKKKDGTARLCFDYRGLNTLVQKARGGPDSYPIPLSDDLRQQLVDARVFSTCDALAGYWQIRVREDCIAKTAVRTPLGSFEFLVMGFGHEGAPAHFQRFMTHMMAPFLHKFVVVFIDDICIYSNSLEEHAEHLRLVMEQLRKFSVQLKRSKCHFFQSQVEFLGHRVGAGVVTPVMDKLEAIRQWPQPYTKAQLRGFLGLAGYYSEFIQGFSEIAEPLTTLSRDEMDVEADWDERCGRAFERLKLALTAAPVLSMADPSKPYQLFVDASLVAAGAVLMQEDDKGGLHPVAYFSKKFSKAEGRYGATARELLGLVLALRKWRHYLMGCKGIDLWTDCKPLTWLRTQSELQDMHIRWLDLLENFPLTLKHVKGVDNVVADALSRRPDYEAARAALTSLCAGGESADCAEEQEIRRDLAGHDGRLLMVDARQWLTTGADEREPSGWLLASAAERVESVQEGLTDCLDEVRRGYEKDVLVQQAQREAEARGRKNERAPQSESQQAGRPDVAERLVARQGAALEAAHRRLREAGRKVERQGAPAAAASLEAHGELLPMETRSRKGQSASTAAGTSPTATPRERGDYVASYRVRQMGRAVERARRAAQPPRRTGLRH